MTTHRVPNVIPASNVIPTPYRGTGQAPAGIYVAEAPTANGPQECQFISPVPIRLVADGKPIERGNSLFNGNYITRVTIPFRGAPVEIGVRANGWKQSTAIFLNECPARVIETPLKPDFGFEECRVAYQYPSSSKKGDFEVNWQEPGVKVGDTLVAMFLGKTPREVDITLTTDGTWTTPQASFARNADWPRLSFPIHQLSSSYLFSLSDNERHNLTLYQCRGDMPKDKMGTVSVSPYPAITPKFCQPKPGQLCKEVDWVFPDGSKKTTGKTTGTIPNIDGRRYKKCLGIFDLFGRRIASCSVVANPQHNAKYDEVHYESQRLSNGSLWEPSRNRGDYLLFGNQ